MCDVDSGFLRWDQCLEGQVGSKPYRLQQSVPLLLLGTSGKRDVVNITYNLQGF